MVTLKEIRNDLKDIKYYMMRKNVFENSNMSVGKNRALEKLNIYNEMICSAPPRLYDVYVSLYLKSNTQESLADQLGYSEVYISLLNGKLVKFFQDEFKKKEVK